MKKRTHCHKGHELSDSNIYVRKNGQRQCKICRDANIKEYSLKRTKFTPELYDAISAAQDHVCAICKRPCPTGHRLAGDHNHETGEPRGLLCVRCNTLLGQVGDSILLLQAAIEYLRKYQKV